MANAYSRRFKHLLKTTKKKQYTAIDLFCEAGGTTLGLANAGFKVIAGVEINHLAAVTFRANHPKVKLFERDIKDLTADDILSALKLKRGELDLLAGCPPCQGFRPIELEIGRLQFRMIGMS